jgi:hypothetical protein
MSNPLIEKPEDHQTEVAVTVRTPAGASHSFTFKLDELVTQAVFQSIRYFVERSELAPGDYGLALVREGRAEDLTDTSRLDDYRIVNGDFLHLIPEAPQVDG